tara:strand:+ start:78 stop:1619 length:1542 start_codon:yes stop_codon:yes gene_type:complete
MPINFLDNVQFNQNQLLGARLQVETADANVTSPVSGQIIYNSTSNKFKYYNGTDWVEPGAFVSWTLQGDVGSNQVITNGNTVDIAGGTLINTVANATDTLTINHDSVSRTDGGSSVTLTSGGTFTATDGVTSTAQGHITGITTKTYTLPSSATYLLDARALAANSVALDLDASTGTDSTVAFTTASDNNVAIVRSSATQINIGLQNSITLSGNLTAVNVNTSGNVNANGDVDAGTLQVQGEATFNDDASMEGNKITSLANPSASSDAANKAYVDSSVAGGLTVKGGFNAATGAIATGGNLTVGASRVAIAIGDYYIVTTSGNFFGQSSTPLTPGDSVLVQTAAAAGTSTINNFAVIQSDTDLATLTTVGIGNVNSNATANRKGLSLSYSGGTATVGLAIGSLPNSGAVSTLDPQNIEFALYNDDSGANERITLQQIQQGISASASGVISGASNTITHNLGTRNIIVQLYDTSTYDTVYGSVSRPTTNTATIGFSSTPTNSIRWMAYNVDVQGV